MSGAADAVDAWLASTVLLLVCVVSSSARNVVESTVLEVVVDDVGSCANVEVGSVSPTEEDRRGGVLLRGVVNEVFGETGPGLDTRVILFPPSPCPVRVTQKPSTQHQHGGWRACPRPSSCCLGCKGPGVGVATYQSERVT